VPYRGAQAAYQDLIGGRVDLFFDLAPTAARQIAGGRVKALATSGGSRNPALPDLVTLRESGVAPLELESWFGLFAPAGTPADVLQRLRQELAAVTAAADVTDAFVKAGGKPLALGAEPTRALVARDVSRWTALIRDAGITPE
jgi:tripartite-type tricarboxylate transporter receptor subunit TctC